MVPVLYLWMGCHCDTLVHSPQAVDETFSCDTVQGEINPFDFCSCWFPEVCDKCTNASLSPAD